MTGRWGAVAAVLAAVAAGAAIGRADEAVRDGAAITPEVAQALYERVGQLPRGDGCSLTRFDTSRFRILIGLRAPSGVEHQLEVATAPELVPVARRVGGWAIAAPTELARDCPATVAGIEQALLATRAPTDGWRAGGEAVAWVSGPSPYVVLIASFALLVLGTLHLLLQQWRRHRPPLAAVLALALVWLGALVLRLAVSPRTFLHEYYHIAETVVAYLSGEVTPGYGRTGPALIRLTGLLLGRFDDPHVIFLTNAVVSSLAVPAMALLVLAVAGSWAQAVCAAVLVAVWPQHLRYSAAEDLFVQAVTFGAWALALCALYLRERGLEAVLLAAVALSLAVQTRPEMILFPAVALAFFLCTAPRQWRLLFAWRTLLALGVLVVLLVPHLLDVWQAMRLGRSPQSHWPSPQRWFDTLVFLDPAITPLAYRVLVGVGAAWAALYRPGWLVWAAAVYVGYTLFAISLFDNPPYRLRAQILPTAFLLLLAAGAASGWLAAWGARRRAAYLTGAGALALLAVWTVSSWRGFIGELFDQQLEWAFLERSVPQLPDRGTLLAAIEQGGSNLDAFPELLLQRAGKRYDLVDVRQAARGATAWPPAGDGALYYQGMYCYIAFDHEPSPDPMTPVCRAVHDHYVLEPLRIEDLHARGYSAMRYAQGGAGVYRIGFYRLRPREEASPPR